MWGRGCACSAGLKMAAATRSRARLAAAARRSFDILDRDAQLVVLSYVDDYSDAAALMLAVPPLGIEAMRSFPQKYKHPLLSIAMAVHCAKQPSDVLTEKLLRRYVCERQVSKEGAHWLDRLVESTSASVGNPCSIYCEVIRVTATMTSQNYYVWPAQPVLSAAFGALVRRDLLDGSGTTSTSSFFEGEEDDERKVRTELSCGQKMFYEGEQDEERLVRIELPGGQTIFYEGEKGEERKVRDEMPSRKKFFEGEHGNERLVWLETANGTKSFYEGEKGKERMVRIEIPCGQTIFYEGEKDQERKVRVELPCGSRIFYEGEKDEERAVRFESDDGTDHFFTRDEHESAEGEECTMEE